MKLSDRVEASADLSACSCPSGLMHFNKYQQQNLPYNQLQIVLSGLNTHGEKKKSIVLCPGFSELINQFAARLIWLISRCEGVNCVPGMSEGGQGPSACLPVRGLHKGPTSVMPFQHLNLWLRLTLVIRAPFHTVSTDIQLLGYLVSIDLRTIRPMATEKDTHLCSWNWLICFYCYSYLGFYIVC